jgi:hypothetical protein
MDPTTQQIIDSSPHKIGDPVTVDGVSGTVAAYEIHDDQTLSYQVTLDGVLHTGVHSDNMERA